ncbi:hypothetical protein LEAN103870_05975 [Legionella anisa]|uniref:Coiled-coil protein n=1 Tax=Legionella anisa TaxID=28082 RepID=A0AAX0WQ15_9GAMM|nr:hypothetical protein [Legionella anisa]AWN75626.1 hypothetical protein DLD14_18265 [Legionella anisa]KTC76420.1 coiled-coil protein [Legionella anisa]MBN5934806.1 hypothetical protein [Legionella anisa]MCW8424177.1 hypothetical protein [Legionella anisa]MCW8446705.1 hypothetical protein [Legionella anisa]
MEGKLELYQQEIKAATQPIFARLEHYRKAMFDIRKLLMDYFFNPGRTQRLTEVAQGEELVFSFNMVQEVMEKCLVDEHQLVETAQAIIDAKKNPGNPSLVAAFDTHVLQSGLPLEFREQEGLYLFKPEKPYTPMAQIFMRQFACALGAYRVCLSICETYFALYNHEGVATKPLQNYIDLANDLKQHITEESDLIALHKQAKTIENEIIALLRTEKVHEGLPQFKHDIEALKIKLIGALEAGAVHLQNCYKEFPNDAILWMLHDRSWHALVKTVSGLLYAQYNYSTLYSTLEINKEIIGLIKKEIEQFDTVVCAKEPLLKIELLRKAAKLINEAKIDVLAKLAENEIELIEAPKMGMFSTPPSNSIYGLILAYQQRQLALVNTFGEATVDKEENEEFKQRIDL